MTTITNISDDTTCRTTITGSSRLRIFIGRDDQSVCGYSSVASTNGNAAYSDLVTLITELRIVAKELSVESDEVMSGLYRCDDTVIGYPTAVRGLDIARLANALQLFV